MRKPIYFIGACALGPLVAVAAILVWSQNALVSSRADAVGITSTDISKMHQNANNLPVEALHDMSVGVN